MKTICMPRVSINRDPDAAYRYNVQLWHSYDGGKTFTYAGEGRFCRTLNESTAYIKANRTPLPEFPVITDDRQRDYEKCASQDDTPQICGYYGRACRVMNAAEGANRLLCIGCKLAEHCAAADMAEYAGA